jgi:hypothetical protein
MDKRPASLRPALDRPALPVRPRRFRSLALPFQAMEVIR